MVDSIAYGYALTAVVTLFTIYNGARTSFREKPWIPFLIGIAVSIWGVILWRNVGTIEQLSAFLCKAHPTSTCDHPGDAPEVARRIIETVFTAVGAGLIAFSMDVRSERCFAADVAEKKRELHEVTQKVEDKKTEREKYENDSSVEGKSAWKKLTNELSELLTQQQEKQEELSQLLGLHSPEDLEHYH